MNLYFCIKKLTLYCSFQVQRPAGKPGPEPAHLGSWLCLLQILEQQAGRRREGMDVSRKNHPLIIKG